MNLHILKSEALDPAFSFLPPKMASQNSIILLGATAIQESNLEHRKQVGGPAVSFWQFEKIGIKEVLINAATKALAADACKLHGVPADVNSVYEFFKTPQGDILAAIFARLNYWTNRNALPNFNRPNSETLYWEYYKSTWRPGKPHLHRWPRSFWRAYGAFEG